MFWRPILLRQSLSDWLALGVPSCWASPSCTTYWPRLSYSGISGDMTEGVGFGLIGLPPEGFPCPCWRFGYLSWGFGDNADAGGDAAALTASSSGELYSLAVLATSSPPLSFFFLVTRRLQRLPPRSLDMLAMATTTRTTKVAIQPMYQVGDDDAAV